MKRYEKMAVDFILLTCIGIVISGLVVVGSLYVGLILMGV